MARKKRKKKSSARLNAQTKKPVINAFVIARLRELGMISLVALAGFLLLALVSYHSNDPGWTHLVNTDQVHNAAGRAGAWTADLLLHLWGYLAFLIPFLLIYQTWLWFDRSKGTKKENSPLNIVIISMRWVGFILIIVAGSGLAGLHDNAGGILGDLIFKGMIHIFNVAGAILILTALLLISLTLFTEISWIQGFEWLGAYGFKMGRLLLNKRQAPLMEKIQPEIRAPIKPDLEKEPKIAPVKPKIKAPVPETEEISKEMRRAPRFSQSESNTLPDLSLLDSGDHKKRVQISEYELENLSRQLESHLSDFGVAVQVVGVQPGPVVTRFELQLAAGTKVSKISNLSKDLARSLSVISVRVVEVIPGKSVIGLELPNKDRESVYLQEVLASKAYANARSALTLALGKDIAGHPVVVDLAKMPHLLVAGTTGAGKSVSLNAMLLSLLYKATPKQLRMIMIDPKMLELSVYDGIPHLLTPVVTDMRDASSALRWCVMEMERRYRLMSALGVRNIAGYNAKVHEAAERGTPLLDPLPRADDEEQKALQELPQIVVLADEFADMMVVVGKKVETLIARLAQKARAAGVHLILATQRPSVDVITGLIKANIPTRIAFQVSSKIDSRTILDQQGAEQLLGNGDMLYLAPGTGVPVRVHGAYVSDDEVHRVVADLKKKGKPDYVEDILNDIGSFENGASEDAMGPVEGNAEQDSLYDEAVAMVAKSRKVSISSIQRRFKIGYNRAARIVEAMENAGVVSKMETHGAREVLVPATE